MDYIAKSTYVSIPRQAKKLEERRQRTEKEINCCNLNIIAEPGVYDTSGDSILMIESVCITNKQSFLEIGCGSGIVSIALAEKAKFGVAVDVSQSAVQNSVKNSKLNQVRNIDFFKSDMFEKVKGKFDVVICNPPYTNHPAKDNVDRMFWDQDDKMKRKFFEQLSKFLRPNGRVYFGWANFSDIDVNLPFKLASENGFVHVNTFTKPHHSKQFTFFVLEFKRSNL